MRKIFYSVLLAAVAAAAAFGQAQSPAEKRAREMVEMINAGDPVKYEKYVKENFGGEFADFPMEAHLDFFFSVRANTGGFDIVGVREQQPNRIILDVKSRLTGEPDGLIVGVEDKEPYKITGLGTRAPAVKTGDGSKMSDAEIATEMDSFVKKLVAADVFSGSVLLAKDGKIIFKGAWGMANKDFEVPNRIDTKFNLGSMNKMFTALSIARLVEAGKVSLDDPLSKFIPDFPDEESAKKILIKHLLSHTSGLGGYFSEGWQSKSRASFRTVDDMMAQAKADEKLQFEPGTRWRYSNTGMLVLGKVIEIASGKSYFEFVDENILAPAGMKNTGCFELDKINKNLAVGYHKEFGPDGVTLSNNIFMHVMRGGPQGGCYSTAEDLFRFAQAMRENRIVSEGTKKTFTTTKPELQSTRYGFGFGVNDELGFYGHGGGFPGISANLQIYRDSGWTAIVLSNYSRAADPLINKMERIIAGQK